MHTPIKNLLPGATLGVLGGGQLGRMFVHCAQRMGYQTVVLDPDPQSPAGLVSHHHVVADYANAQGLRELIHLCDAITTEFENVPAHVLKELAAHLPVNPSAYAVSIAQDRIREKKHFTDCNVPVAPFHVITDQKDLDTISGHVLPGILKTARLGYDGKGQIRVKTQGELQTAWKQLQSQGEDNEPMPCVLEKLLPLEFECSIVLARNESGHIVHLPPQRNIHRDGILALTQVHAGCLPQALEEQVIEFASAIASQLEYVGVLCVEFFVLKKSHSDALSSKDQAYELVVNEIAPRPHNSGHYSVEACDISQFELQVRCLANLPLTRPRQLCPALMLNLLGDLWLDPLCAPTHPQWREPDWSALLAIEGVHLNLYGKQEPRLLRKMGHITITSKDIEALYKTLDEITHILALPDFERPSPKTSLL